jgi:glycosyltransferase involved in cell wall biosynthesis
MTKKKKLLFFTAKWPSPYFEIDGGSITALQYMEALSKLYDITYLYLQKNKNEELPPFSGFDHCEIVNGSFLNYSNYDKNDGNKFTCRIKNISAMNEMISSRINDYDAVVIVHCLQAMGLEKTLSKENLSKIVLLPMFLSHSYKQIGEYVPEEYTAAEKSILTAVKHIIVPAEEERKEMILEYGIDQKSIITIPRWLDGSIKPIIRSKPREKIEACSVGSFKNQKNNLDAIIVAEGLLKKGFNINLHLLGTIQDKTIYKRCQEYVSKHGLANYVFFDKLVAPNNLGAFYNSMDLSISTSLCETFGRAILEGMAAGIPTVAYDVAGPIVTMAANCAGVKFLHSRDEMIAVCSLMLSNDEIYKKMSISAADFGKKFHVEAGEKMLLSYFENAFYS